MQHILKRKAKNVILYITSRLFSTAKSTVSFGEKTASDVENHVSRFAFLRTCCKDLEILSSCLRMIGARYYKFHANLTG